MSTRRISVCAGLVGAMLAANSAFAAFTGIVVEEKEFCRGDLPPEVTHVCNVYAQFAPAPGDRVIAVAGTPEFPMLIQVLGGGTFYQHSFGNDRPPSAALIEAFPELACDTFVSIGKKDDSGGDATGLTPGWPGFTGDSLGGTDLAWFATPQDQQGEPDASGRVLLGQFTVVGGTGVEGTFLIQTQSDGDPDFRQYVSFSCPLGPDCSGVKDCSGNGECVGQDLCVCDEGWSGDDCSIPVPPIPTVSEWGMIAMSLLILSAGVLMARRRVATKGRTVLLLMACTLILLAPVAFAGGRCPADLDGDGDVGVFDLLVLLGSWGPCPGCPADLDGSGVVTVDDMLDLFGLWGPC